MILTCLLIFSLPQHLDLGAYTRASNPTINYNVCLDHGQLVIRNDIWLGVGTKKSGIYHVVWYIDGKHTGYGLYHMENNRIVGQWFRNNHSIIVLDDNYERRKP